MVMTCQENNKVKKSLGKKSRAIMIHKLMRIKQNNNGI